KKYQVSWYRKIWCDHCTKSHIIDESCRLRRNRLSAITFPLYEVKQGRILVLCGENELSSVSPADMWMTPVNSSAAASPCYNVKAD
ncbi:hypothetical protein ACTXT7_016889, partial [Hymenolepis weldensis]